MPRKIDHTVRQSIAKKLREGVHPSVLAHEYGVSRRTIYRSAELVRRSREDRDSKTETVVCRVSPKDLAAFDAKLARYGIASRSEGLRNIVRNTNGMAVPDAELRDALLGMKAALNRCGNNVVQIAKRLNEARQRGHPGALEDEDFIPIRDLGALILDFADEVWLMAEGRRGNIEIKITEELNRISKLGRRESIKGHSEASHNPLDEDVGPVDGNR